MEDSSLRFGDHIMVIAFLVRERNGDKRTWKREEYSFPHKAIFISNKHFYNGRAIDDSEWDEWSGRIYGGSHFEPDESIKGALVAVERLGEVKVLRSDIVKGWNFGRRKEAESSRPIS